MNTDKITINNTTTVDNTVEIKKDEVVEHTTVKHLTEIVITPDHVHRTESEEFVKSKHQLKKDGHYKCWICDSIESLQVHHFGCEWSLANDCDMNKLKEMLKVFDFYGYSEQMKDIDLLSPDDIRNMLVLCQRHHTHPENGIHEISFPVWISQKTCLTGKDPVPQDN